VERLRRGRRPGRMEARLADQRSSLHIEPRGLRATVQHYLRDLIYGANDGLITTFAVVAGDAGGALAQRTVLVIGVANLFADGLSMAAGNYLGIRSNESVRRAQNLPEEEARPLRHAGATFVAFAVAGALPLLPYVFPAIPADERFVSAVGVTLGALFGIGALRATVTDDRWWISGLEMLGLGVVVAGVAFASGVFIADLVR
jgi:vacuolar iron transporter family protein